MLRLTSRTPPGFRTRLTSYMTIDELEVARKELCINGPVEKQTTGNTISSRLSTPCGCTDLIFRKIQRAIGQPHHVKRITAIMETKLFPRAMS